MPNFHEAYRASQFPLHQQTEAMAEVAFKKEDQLCDKLKISNGQISSVSSPTPSSSSGSHVNGPSQATKSAALPGDPRIELHDADISIYLKEELLTEDLNKLAPHIWLMATQKSGSISSLTEQLARGRKIVISHKPGLHLVWVKNRVFLKPLPEYLLSDAFWQYYLLEENEFIDEDQQMEIAKAARGFLRSYTYLIQRKSDFVLATQDKTRLIPEGIEFEDFIRFVKGCKIDDDGVSPRYQFGELRLNRLNFWTRIFLRKATYYKVEWEYGAYFAQFYAPLLFIFAVVSLLLSSMQVVLGGSKRLRAFGHTLYRVRDGSLSTYAGILLD
ncbi:hypothetical protein G7054_g2677 [Neopestalotiopsis clavispora]|nr:hypothetical protein G7054_g2677 [Neopestalotiopsis clavispora]